MNSSGIRNNPKSDLAGNVHKIKFYHYTIVSIGGLLISVAFFHLTHSLMDMPAFYANWVGDIVALCFVFICSWVFVFDHFKHKFNTKFMFNLVSKLAVIYLLSATLSVISNFLETSSTFQEFDTVRRDLLLTTAKIALAPASLLVNYLLTFIIIEKLNKG